MKVLFPLPWNLLQWLVLVALDGSRPLAKLFPAVLLQTGTVSEHAVECSEKLRKVISQAQSTITEIGDNKMNKCVTF